MARPADLRSAMQASAKSGPKAATVPTTTPTTATEPQAADTRSQHFRPGRSTKTNITGYFSPAVKKQLRMMAAEEGGTIQDLLAEALNSLFASYGKPEIAERAERG